MEIKIINKTPDFLRTIWTAGRTCHSTMAPQELFELDESEGKMLKLVNFLLKARHLSTLEHCSVTYAVAGVSRTLLAQYSRHRIGVSLSVQSQRYVSEGTEKRGQTFEYVTPPTIAADPARLSAYQAAMAAAQKGYDELVAAGAPMEDARFALPGGICTNFVTTLNLRSLLDIYEKRVLVSGAQWEVREMVRRMAELLVEKEPWLAGVFEGVSPK
ncbi:MAG: FAD-dependent thymidylate synthase [Pyramidobacter sp.]|uniref:FAD-dependent thymidylate synthase n=1 Tax=unclassified Pyramidobacter TaxID=2632171 RepID=UPI000990330C|nr:MULTISPECIES: FAD-dependent thymidylate synthase [unclassified Pyramidobacter]MCI7404360.1 FAD-dependent thymidylate synthase [Pyramidobacter sp.]MDY3213163.1 FAD-dependent thymidylate synthase [Pyramidobacter sp.]MDY4032723.1 FAD-dependent thymidylate synthase [Pyramidobacter sp.]OON87310.1 thymidylate synthase (FAD) [Pyramidobacter sp. C12-8]WOL40702.1 FAD-dependent thymidylate synthase [Pyramidobacter sp. YE332]